VSAPLRTVTLAVQLPARRWPPGGLAAGAQDLAASRGELGALSCRTCAESMDPITNRIGNAPKIHTHTHTHTHKPSSVGFTVTTMTRTTTPELPHGTFLAF
jgi:hypothetical protein